MTPAPFDADKFVTAAAPSLGNVTLAGSRINAANPAAVADATLVRRLCDAGAVLVGMQIIAPPWREDLCLRVAAALEQRGWVGARRRVMEPAA